MSFLTVASCLLVFVCDCSAVDIMPELKKNILNFGYGVNFKYEGMLSHSFDRFYIVTKFELPKTKDLKLATFGFDFECKTLLLGMKRLLLVNYMTGWNCIHEMKVFALCHKFHTVFDHSTREICKNV